MKLAKERDRARRTLAHCLRCLGEAEKRVDEASSEPWSFQGVAFDLCYERDYWRDCVVMAEYQLERLIGKERTAELTAIFKAVNGGKGK